jgi:hypothetical protein
MQIRLLWTAGFPIVVAGCLGLVGCQAGQQQPEVLSLSPGSPGTRAATLALGRKQGYDPDIGAAARTLVDDSLDVTLEPMDNAFATDSAHLGRGVVVARLINHSNRALKRLGLAPGATTYWLIYRKGDQLLSDFIADAPDSSYDRTGVTTLMHRPKRPWKQSIAQWQSPGDVEGLGAGAMLMAATSSQPWTTCNPFGCCKPAD